MVRVPFTFTGTWPHLLSGTQQTWVRAPASPSLPSHGPPTSFCSGCTAGSHRPLPTPAHGPPCPDPLLSTARPSSRPRDPLQSTCTIPSFATPPVAPCILSPWDISRISNTSLCLHPPVSRPRSNGLPENGRAAPSSPVILSALDAELGVGNSPLFCFLFKGWFKWLMSAGSSTYIQNNLGQVAFYFWVSVTSFLKKKKNRWKWIFRNVRSQWYVIRGHSELWSLIPSHVWFRGTHGCPVPYMTGHRVCTQPRHVLQYALNHI